MKNIHILPTDKASRLIQAEDDELMLLNELYENTHNINKHIYITSDKEIKEGDWVIFNELEIVKCTYSKNGEFLFSEPLTSSSNHHFSYFKKIILTTDQDLINDGVQAIDDEFLNWFVKNPSCDFVRTLKVPYFDESSHSYLLVIPKEESKQELSLKINDEFLDTTSKEILYTLMEEFDNLVTENSSEETLEEAAEKYANKKGDIPTTKLEDAIFKQGFIDGAKWQQEQNKNLYSEEDLREAFRQGEQNINYSEIYGLDSKLTEQEWFEKFKKK